MTQPSGRLQTGLASLVHDAIINAAAHVQEHGKDERHAEKTEFLENLESEGVEAIQQIIGHLLTDEMLNAPGGEILRRIAEPEHQVELVAILGVLVRVAWEAGGAILIGPMTRLQTLSLRNTGDLYPSPMEGASAAARHRISNDVAEAWKNNNGFRAVPLDQLIDANLNTLPAGVAMALLQQGKIDGSRFVEIMQHNAMDSESMMDFVKLRYQPPSVAVAMNAVTQNQLEPGEVQEIMDQNGIDPVNYQWMFETNGRSPGVDMLNKLRNYGLIDDDLWTQGILESPIKNKYVDALKSTRFHRPPMRTTLQMLHAGTIDKPKALEYLDFLGFFPEDAEVMANAALKQKTEGTKALTAANIRGMYVEGLIDRGQAEARITELGYDATDTELFLDYADSVRQRQRLNTALSHIRAQYLGHKIDEPTAIGAIDRLGVPGAMRSELIADWEIEHEVTITHLSDAVILKAGTSKLLTPDEVYRRLIAKGYRESDARLLMDEKGIGHAEAAQLKDLTVAQILKLMAEERISIATAKQRLMAKGYSNEDAQNLIDSKLQTPVPGADGTP